ncbi:hypothetical protein O4160_15490 [Rhodococcus sp. IEGM 1401]|uniref:hypothetical protein n=1 Tax=unclassified Rhodococcus (in: high G+C Gram-positive bacteria) TaxID=192944 RepID=UPI0022B459CE|nr:MULTISPECIES: hypothetical protein [unclassified Rhodococcus (in: high G+C Gram-positive bacteria)]MCZ4562245.1 hypothetical protein [Rhodococcus sp. IEGM 1401]MDI9922288.1 hypothetical protein [Rhodococcus sp. IEGM 1372]MDV8035312.1 hypothetical protein [Rhodococcus sp. IEGM 1414]
MAATRCPDLPDLWHFFVTGVTAPLNITGTYKLVGKNLRLMQSDDPPAVGVSFRRAATLLRDKRRVEVKHFPGALLRLPTSTSESENTAPYRQWMALRLPMTADEAISAFDLRKKYAGYRKTLEALERIPENYGQIDSCNLWINWFQSLDVERPPPSSL